MNEFSKIREKAEKIFGPTLVERALPYLNGEVITDVKVYNDNDGLIVSAKIQGRESYKTHLILSIDGEYVEGFCSCPAFEHWYQNSCKHLAALYMFYFMHLSVEEDEFIPSKVKIKSGEKNGHLIVEIEEDPTRNSLNLFPEGELPIELEEFINGFGGTPFNSMIIFEGDKKVDTILATSHLFSGKVKLNGKVPELSKEEIVKLKAEFVEQMGMPICRISTDRKPQGILFAGADYCWEITETDDKTSLKPLISTASPRILKKVMSSGMIIRGQGALNLLSKANEIFDEVAVKMKLVKSNGIVLEIDTDTPEHLQVKSFVDVNGELKEFPISAVDIGGIVRVDKGIFVNISKDDAEAVNEIKKILSSVDGFHLSKDRFEVNGFKNVMNALEKLNRERIKLIHTNIKQQRNFKIKFSDRARNLISPTVTFKPVVKIRRDKTGIDWFNVDFSLNVIDENGKVIAEISPDKLSGNVRRYEQDLFIDIDEIGTVKVSEKTKNKVEELFAPLPEKVSTNVELVKTVLSSKEKGFEIESDKFIEELLKEMTQRKITNDNPNLPNNLWETLKDYQQKGVLWLRFLNKWGFGGILADDMGLGKTIQTLAFLVSINPNKPSLVVAPKTLMYNWTDEIKKFNVPLKYEIITGRADKRKESISNINEYDLIITSYPVLRQDIDLFSKFDFYALILDEAQNVKNRETLSYKAVKSITADFKIALTGTPVENRPEELHTIFSIVMPKFLDSVSKFRNDYRANPDKAIESLSMKTAPFILRRRKNQVAEELPPRLEQIIPVELSPIQKEIYLQVIKEIRGEIFKEISEKGVGKSIINVLSALTKLRQICDDVRLVIDDWYGENDIEEISPKISVIMDLLEDVVESGRKAVVFSGFVKMLGFIKEAVEKRGWGYKYLDGKTRNRDDVVKRFINESDPIFLLSLKVGGYGLNLQTADTVIIVDPWWNPMIELQAADRVHRIGQINPVNVYRLIAKGTVEEKMEELKKRKMNLFKTLVDDAQTVIENLTEEDIKYLFSNGD